MTSADNLGVQSLQNFENVAFGQRIAYIIDTRGLSKTWLAEKLGISKQALNYLLNHSVKPKFVDEFAELLSLDPQWIEYGIGTPSSSINQATEATHAYLPIFTKSTLLEKVKPNNTIEFTQQPIDAFTAYKLEDDSNFPPFIEGSILIFNTKKQPKNEDYVLFTIGDKAFVRQYLVDGDAICYKASNSQHKTFINPKTKILGVLIEVRYQI